MLNLLNTGTADKIEMVTSTAGDIDAVCAGADLNISAQTSTPIAQRATSTAAETKTILDGPTPTDGSVVRNGREIQIRNTSPTITNDVLVQVNVGGTVYELHKATLQPGDKLEYVEGVGWFTIAALTNLKNFSTASQTPFSSDTYLVGSNIALPNGITRTGVLYHLTFDVSKTNAGTATPIITVRFGTLGTTGDTARCTLTFGAGTAAVDVGTFEVFALFRTVGSGTSAVIQGVARLTSNLTTTGISNAVKTALNTGGGFDSTVASSIIGASYNGGASAAHTIQMVYAEILP